MMTCRVRCYGLHCMPTIYFVTIQNFKKNPQKLRYDVRVTFLSELTTVYIKIHSDVR